MSWIAKNSAAPPITGDLKSALQIALAVFAAYWLGAEAAFLVGTLSDKIFAPFWPPNIILLCALLLVPSDRRWICILASFPAHVIAEARIGMPLSQMLVAFATNLMIAMISAVVIQRLMGDSPWFSSFRKTALFVVFVGFLCPAIVAFGGAFVPILGGGALENYWTFWGQWFMSNAVGGLALGPIALIVASEGAATLWSQRLGRQAEALLLGSALIVVCDVAFRASMGQPGNGFLPTLLYAPVPLLLWSAARFGARGAGAAMLIMTVVLTWRSLNGPSLFLAGTAEANAFALQIFLVSLAVPVLLLGSSIDEARQAERQLRDDEERMAFVAAAANVGFWQENTADGRFWATDHCNTMFGLRKDTPATREAILAAVHPDDRHIAVNAISARIQLPGKPLEFRIVMPDGRIKWILARSNQRYADNGVAIDASGIFTDVTERKVAEAEADLQRRELAHLMRVSQVGELSGGLAHELTQPLTAILANAQAARVMLAADVPDLTDIAEVLDDIIQEDHRAGEVIQRLRSMLKNGKDNFETVDLNDLLKATIRLLRNEMIGRRIKANVMLAPHLSFVSGDSVQLQQVLLNLVMNAIEATNQMGASRRVVTLKTQWAGHDEVEVCVVDRGAGISGADRERIFEPFFTTKERGLGLGLSICSTIIKRHGGKLSLDSNSDGGVTARFRLPAKGKKGGLS